MAFAPMQVRPTPFPLEIKSPHSCGNRECRAPCPAPVAAAGNCVSGLAKGSVPNIEVEVPFSVGRQLVASVFANPLARSSFSEIHPWAAEPPEGGQKNQAACCAAFIM
eukprot:6037675-Pyramimonas_sp.AAC.1